MRTKSLIAGVLATGMIAAHAQQPVASLLRNTEGAPGTNHYGLILNYLPSPVVLTNTWPQAKVSYPALPKKKIWKVIDGDLKAEKQHGNLFMNYSPIFWNGTNVEWNIGVQWAGWTFPQPKFEYQFDMKGNLIRKVPF